MVYLDQELMVISRDKTLDAIEKWKSWIGAGSPKGYGKPQEMVAKPWYRNQDQVI
jgi:acetyl-CoA carboxylase alpha subunit